MGHIDSVATIITERNTTLFDHCRVAPSRTYLEKPLVVVNHGMDAGTLILRAVKGCLYICAYTCITEDKKKHYMMIYTLRGWNPLAWYKHLHTYCGLMDTEVFLYILYSTKFFITVCVR